jgi:hypothetical protein
LALPDRDQFTVVEGDENTTLKTYLFGKKMIAHKVVQKSLEDWARN